MNPTQVALYARVSSAQQADTHTVASQVAALRERMAADGLTVSEAMQFLDEGYSGATLVRPALERLRDVVAASSVDRLYVHSPDRLARKYAYQVLLVDEFRRAGVEVIFLNRALGHSPEDDLLLQVQGMIAEYERAKIIERHRRGKRHAARVGAVNVLSGAPYGYRYVTKYEGGGQARYELILDEARVVRQVLAWVGPDRLTIGEVCRRLTQAGEVTRTGKTVWDRSVVWGILKNPAYQGAAAFGKTRQEPLRPRLRTQRNRPVQPHRAVSTSDVPPEDWITIPVPALVGPEVFATVQEQLQENKRHARQSRRGALYLLQGLLQCQHCGYAFYGKRLSPSARKGKPRAYAYYRCLGTDAYRFGGERVCQNTQVRTDLVDLAVWQEVCTLLAHPERLAEEYRRRLQPETPAKRPPLVTVEGQISQLRQGVARLIDSYADGLIDKHEFEPRITRLRQRLARLEEQRQHLANEAASHAELQLIIGRLEDFATKVHHNLEEADWTSKRELIRTLVKRVEVAQDQVNIVFRIAPYLGDPHPEKKVCNFIGGVISPLLANIYLHELDGYMERYTSLSKGEKMKQRRMRLGNFTFARYADDFVALCNGPKFQVEEMREELYEFLKIELRLELSKEKTKITHVNDGYKFLGFWIQRGRGGKGTTIKIVISEEAVEKMKVKIKLALSPQSHQDSVNAKIMGLNSLIRGWCQYYQYTSKASTQFHELENMLFWEMGHWLGRKFRITMPGVMQRFRRDNTFVSDNHCLLKPTEFPSLQYRQRFFKPNPYLTQERRLEREELPNESYWTGYEARPGMADLRPLILERDEYICQLCGIKVVDNTAEIDHIRPVRRFKRPIDANVEWNLWTLCTGCHQEKTKSDRQAESRVR